MKSEVGKTKDGESIITLCKKLCSYKYYENYSKAV